MEIGIAIGSLVVAVASAVIAVAAWLASRRSSKAAERSASAAERSADAAEVSLAIQHREAEASQEIRHRDKLADIVPLYWESRARQDHRGLVIRNNGPAVARDITAYERTRGGQTRKWKWPSLASGETMGLAENEQPVSDEEAARIGGPGDEGAYAYARLEWSNEDGSAGGGEWIGINKL